jgi:hypothetical protein
MAVQEHPQVMPQLLTVVVVVVLLPLAQMVVLVTLV